MDKNIRHFYNLASVRRNNRINALVINERLIRNQVRIKIVIREFYKDLYHHERSLIVGFRDELVNRIDEEDSVVLERMSTVEEVKDEILDCESSKAPNSDGYNMNFIKKCCDEIGSEFTASMLDFFRSARIPSYSNIMWVSLAPKFNKAKKIKDLRPINMVGCFYKVISKVLVRRIGSVMSNLVGETQSAFVKGQKIHDETFITCETVQ
ncbi:uncharacterized protein LOC130963168 [Arachis stenosperma]|uniref:uncharacterized protein LOC130963168 n=1 Tax=Arachis stenosperma TaxID=217475 RepID=UPI0025ABA012|nr:uncharacterized protein LOC130963168 [Arachis stenosperma]